MEGRCSGYFCLLTCPPACLRGNSVRRIIAWRWRSRRAEMGLGLSLLRNLKLAYDGGYGWILCMDAQNQRKEKSCHHRWQDALAEYLQIKLLVHENLTMQEEPDLFRIG